MVRFQPVKKRNREANFHSKWGTVVEINSDKHETNKRVHSMSRNTPSKQNSMDIYELNMSLVVEYLVLELLNFRKTGGNFRITLRAYTIIVRCIYVSTIGNQKMNHFVTISHKSGACNH